MDSATGLPLVLCALPLEEVVEVFVGLLIDWVVLVSVALVVGVQEPMVLMIEIGYVVV
jgi:hypothetical protein